MSATATRNLFECYVCYSRYDTADRKPKYLSCHHTICFHCITKTMDYSLFRVKCPFCREWTEVKSSSIDRALRTNQDILEFMEVANASNLQRTESTKPLEEHWCRNCQQVAIDGCRDKSHRTVPVSPIVLSDILKVLEESRQSQINWGEAISQRNDLRSIVASIQFSVNALKKRIDALVEENDRQLLALRSKVENAAQSVSDLDPFDFDIDMEGLVAQSTRDVKDVKEKLETFSSLDDAVIHLTGQASVLNGYIRWNDRELEDKKKTTAMTTDFSYADARRILGYILTVVPKPPQPAIRVRGPTCAAPQTPPPTQQATRTTPNATNEVPPPIPPKITPLQPRPKTTVAGISSPADYEPMMRPSPSAPPRESTSSPSPRPDRPIGIGRTRSDPLPKVTDVTFVTNPPPVLEEQNDDYVSPTAVRTTEYIPTCMWNPVENVLAATRKNEPVCLYSGHHSNRITSLATEVTTGNSTTTQPIGQVHRLAWNSRGTQLVTGSTDGWIQFWTSGGVSLHRQKQHEGDILTLKWSSDGKFVATGGRDKRIKIWNVASQNCIQSFTYHTCYTVWDLDWQSPNTFASCGIDGKMFFSDIRVINRPQFEYTGHKGWVKCLRWNPENLLLASCSSDATVKIWTPLVPAFLQEYQNHKAPVNAVDWSPTGPGSRYPNANRYLASCSDDKTAMILDINRQAVFQKLEGQTKPSQMTCLSFSGDGKLIATGNENGVVEIWNVHNGRVVQTFSNLGTKIQKISWSINGNKLGIARHGNYVAIVDLRKQ